MLRPVPTAVVCLYAALSPYARQGSAVSPEAQTVTRAASAIVSFAEESQTLFGIKAITISQLRALANDCAEENWDGNDANPIDSIALQHAEDFVRALPVGFQMPEVAAEPDGSISLDWILAPYHLFTLSVGSNNRLSYAWLNGTDREHGVATFDGSVIPARVLSAIQPFIGYGNASVRVA